MHLFWLSLFLIFVFFLSFLLQSQMRKLQMHLSLDGRWMIKKISLLEVSGDSDWFISESSVEHFPTSHSIYHSFRHPPSQPTVRTESTHIDRIERERTREREKCKPSAQHFPLNVTLQKLTLSESVYPLLQIRKAVHRVYFLFKEHADVYEQTIVPVTVCISRPTSKNALFQSPLRITRRLDNNKVTIKQTDKVLWILTLFSVK